MKRQIKKKNNLANTLGKYDSKFEIELHDSLMQTWDYHPTRLPYIIEKTYEPDFVKEIDGVQFLCEAKGVFWDSTETKKYKEIVKGTNEMINLQLNRVEEMGMNKIYITSYLIRSDGSP